MKEVYLIMSGEGYGRVLGVVSTSDRATYMVHAVAAINYNIHINEANRPPLDYSGEDKRYGWKDYIWWQKEEVLV